MDMFKESSGLKIDKSKTKIMQVGKKDWNLKQFNLDACKDDIYTLGTWFYKDSQKPIY